MEEIEIMSWLTLDAIKKTAEYIRMWKKQIFDFFLPTDKHPHIFR